ncbi:MAG: Holliday junction resolvase RuvX [Flavobacteriaceae bacterium]
MTATTYESDAVAGFAGGLAPGPLVGLDPGTRTIGVALSDRTRMIASPFRLIRRTKFAADGAALLDVVAGNAACGFVVGLPRNMDGSEGPRAQSVRAFVRNLAGLTELPILFWDERLSTVAAERAMIDAGLSRAKRGERIDAAAAAFILQGALDRLGRLAR